MLKDLNHHSFGGSGLSMFLKWSEIILSSSIFELRAKILKAQGGVVLSSKTLIYR